MEKPSDFRKVPTEGNRKASTTRYGGFGVPASENVDSEVYETSVNHAEQRKRSAVFTFSTQIFLRKAEEEMLHSGLLALSVENGEMTLYESKHMERLLIADLSRMLSLTIKGEARLLFRCRREKRRLHCIFPEREFPPEKFSSERFPAADILRWKYLF